MLSPQRKKEKSLKQIRPQDAEWYGPPKKQNGINTIPDIGIGIWFDVSGTFVHFCWIPKKILIVIVESVHCN